MANPAPRRARRFGTVAALVLCAGVAKPALAAADRLQAFEIKDQFDRVHTDADLRGTPALVFGSDRKGSAFNSTWVDAVRESLTAAGRPGDVDFVEVADLRSVPFFVKRMVKGKFPRERSAWVLLDWKGWFARTYAFEKDSCTILLFDSAGMLHHWVAVREMDRATLEVLLERLAEIAER